MLALKGLAVPVEYKSLHTTSTPASPMHPKDNIDWIHRYHAPVERKNKKTLITKEEKKESNFRCKFHAEKNPKSSASFAYFLLSHCLVHLHKWQREQFLPSLHPLRVMYLQGALQQSGWPRDPTERRGDASSITSFSVVLGATTANFISPIWTGSKYGIIKIGCPGQDWEQSCGPLWTPQACALTKHG